MFVIALCEILWILQRKAERQIQKENHMLELEIAFMKEYYATLENQLAITRKFHHDIEKHMAVLNGLEEEYQKILPATYCENPVVNAILTNRVRQCEQQDIYMDIQMQDFHVGNMKEIDMIALLANVLDNAVEACLRIPDSQPRTVTVQGNQRGENLFLQVKNNIERAQMIEDNLTPQTEFKTQKTDKYAHGVGVQIIREIVEKYHGTLDVKKIQMNEETLIEVMIQLPVGG